MIELIEGMPANIVAVSCRGHVSKSDYEQVLIPAVESALKKYPKIRLFYRIGPEFEGIDPSAVLEDMKVGFAHLSKWERIAIVTDIEWIRLTIRAFAFLIPGPLRIFDVNKEKEAQEWIANNSPRSG